MNDVISASSSTIFAGKRFKRKKPVVEIWRTVNSCRGLNLRELGHRVCENHNWRTTTGKDRIQVWLRALREMEAVGLFELPKAQKLDRPEKVRQKAS